MVAVVGPRTVNIAHLGGRERDRYRMAAALLGIVEGGLVGGQRWWQSQFHLVVQFAQFLVSCCLHLSLMVTIGPFRHSSGPYYPISSVLVEK